VCWDDFDAEEVWGSIAPRDTQRGGPPKERHPQRSHSGPLRHHDEEPHIPPTRERRSFGSTGGGGGRWQRGLAIPAEDPRRSDSNVSNNHREAENPDDLWDDPSSTIGVGAAADFSAFGGSLENGPKGTTGMGDAFELEDMSKAAAAFEAELHGTKNINGDHNDEEEEQFSHAVDATRPLASTGMTMGSGSGESVNVFEDFGDDDEENAEKTEEESAIKSGHEEADASSRLMKMIGVGETGVAASSKDAVVESEASAQEKEAASIPSNPWGAAPSIPSNPWGEPVASDQSSGFGSLLGTQPVDAAAQRQKEEEERRRQLQEEEEKKKQQAEIQAKKQAEALAQQQNQQMRQQQNQVELVLIERISNILENSWGRTDLVSILTTLHADDSRVIAILANPDALRALIARHPQRIALVRDPAMGAEMAALVLTNQQWQMQQARAQQSQAREQEELQRRRVLEEQQQRLKMEALAREREAHERQIQLQKQQQQQQPQAVVSNAPWFYADPQGNIQGPFAGEEMRQWLEAGYFKGNLPISQNNSGPFRPLSTYFPDPQTAFQPSSAQMEAQQKHAAELKRREEEAARLLVETQQRELEVQAKAEAEARKKIEEKAKLEAEEKAKQTSKEASNQTNQSTQLKMMLGLGASDAAPAALAPQASQPEPKKQPKSKANQKSVREPSPVVEVAPAPPAAPAWGGAASGQPSRKKTMSEIQQEEAKAAAKRASEGGQRSSGGWANIAATGGNTAWSGGAAKVTPAGVVTPNAAVIASTTSVQPVKSTRAAPTVHKTQSQQEKSSSNKAAVDNFGANGKMSPAFENWCKSQMQKINNSDDLTLVSFCMTLTDPIEIRQYLTAYLGSSPEVNNFANEFIKKKDGNNGRQEEWESAGGPKKNRKKKGGK